MMIELAWKPNTNIIQDHLWPHEVSDRYGKQKYNKYTINFDCMNATTETDFLILIMTYWYDVNVLMVTEDIINEMMGINA